MLAWLALPPWLRTALLALVVVAGLAAVAGLTFWRGMARIDAMVSAAADGARKTQDAKWQAVIDKSNAEAERARSDTALRFAALETDRMIAMARAANLDAELERKNAELPKPNACALDVGRWRLLDGPAP